MNNLLRYILKGRANQQYQERGYHVFRRAFRPDQIDTIADLATRLITPYGGEILRQDGKLAVNEFFPGTQLIKNSAFNAHLPISEALEPLSTALRALITSPALAERLRKLDGVDHYHIQQTLLFFAAQTTGLHLDSWSLDTVPRGFAHTVWIPLQNLDFRSGVPSVIPWPKEKVVTEEELGLVESDMPFPERYERYHRALTERLLSDSPEAVTPLMRKGDFIVWSSLTPHFTLPSLPFPTQRLSLQILIRPAHHRWGDFIVQPTEHPVYRAMRINERFSFYVSQQISHDFGISDDPRGHHCINALPSGPLQ
jgi:Phytanoyl-CoA dioxygenase (PhyH)